jgi:hypothetical protein
MGKKKDLKPVSGLEIRSAVMGIPVTITEEVIAKACRVVSEGRFQNNVKRDDILLKSYYNLLLDGNSEAKTSEMEIHHRMRVKFCTDCFLQRGGGSDQPNHEQKLAIYFMATYEKINLPKYILHHLCWAIDESINKGRKQVPCGRLLSEIFHQGRVLEFLRRTKDASDKCFKVSTAEKTISSRSLYFLHFIKQVPQDEKFMEMTTAESEIIRNFPSIIKENNPEVLAGLVAAYRESGANSQEEVATAKVRGKKAKTTSELEAAAGKAKQQKVAKRKR